MFKIGTVKIESDGGLFVIAGPCVIETEEICLNIATRLAEISKKTGIPVIFKASFDKANRSSIDSFRGPGMEKGLAILAKVKQKTSLAILTDVHEIQQVCARQPRSLTVYRCLRFFAGRPIYSRPAARPASRSMSKRDNLCLPRR